MNGPRRSRDHASAQRGAALLIALLILVSAGLALLLTRLAASPALAGDAATLRKMAQARDALIGRAATDDNRPGSLPCPDTDDDGVAQMFSGNQCPAYLGRIPWKTLELGDLRDEAGERLWYALAPALRDSPSVEPLNAQTSAELSLDGQANIAAIVFSPGAPTPAQSGRPSNLASDYLDGANGDGSYAYVSGPRTDGFNDKVLAIRRDDLFSAVNLRVLGEIRGPADASAGLRKAFKDSGAFPWADTDLPLDGLGNALQAVGKAPYNELQLKPETLLWLANNNWFALLAYDRTNPVAAMISLGSASLTVAACPATPCP